MTALDGEHLDPVRRQVAGIHEHAHRDEEQHGEGLAERQQVGAHLVAERRLADDDAGEKRAERERDAEERAGGERRAGGGRQRDQHEELARPRVHGASDERGHDARPDRQHQDDEQQRLAERPRPAATTTSPERRRSQERAAGRG